MIGDRTLQALRHLRAGLATMAVVLAGVGLWLALDNPTINNTSRGDRYSCLAPWDTVLNDANNYPGGEAPPDGDQIAERCRDAGRERFDTAVILLVGSGVVALAAGTVGLVAYRRDRRPLA